MDETTTDVVPAEGGEQETPSPETSTQGTEQGSSSEESPIEALSQQVTELTGMMRALQSGKDKGVARVSKDVKDLSDQLETYYQRREAGQSHEQALREEALDEIVAERRGTPGDTSVPPKEEPAAQTTVAVDDYLSAILKATGLTSNDPDVVEILRDSDPIKRLNAIGALAETRKQAQTTPGSAAAVLPSGAGGAVESETLESVTEELRVERAKPIKDFKKIGELGKKHLELLPKQ